MSASRRWYAPQVKQRGGGFMTRRRALWLGALSAATLVIAVLLLTGDDHSGFALVVRGALVGCLVVTTYSFFAHALFNTAPEGPGGGA